MPSRTAKTAPSAAAPTAPYGLPEPRRHAHLDPSDGACLMEAVSVLAGEPFTDGPRSTHPALAALARAVNDAVGDRARRELWPLAAGLAHARPATRSFAPLLIADAVREARYVRPRSRVLALRRARCLRRAGRLGAREATSRWAVLLDALWWRGPGRHHLEHAVRTLLRAPDAEERLVTLLHRAVALATTGARGPCPRDRLLRHVG